MGQALVVANITEGFECRDARLQDALGHQRFKVTCIAQALHILPEDAVQRFVAVDFNATLFAQCTYLLDDERVQSIQSSFGLVLLNGLAHVLSDCFKIAFVDRSGQCVQLGNGRVAHHALGEHPAVFG